MAKIPLSSKLMYVIDTMVSKYPIRNQSPGITVDYNEFSINQALQWNQ